MYSKRKDNKPAFTKLFKTFCKEIKTDRKGKEFANLLYKRYTVEDFNFSDDWKYWTVHGYFEQVVVPHKIEVYKAGLDFIKSGFAQKFLGLEDTEIFKENLWLHDMSKFSANESFGYAFYNRKTNSGKALFDEAWHHHKMNNPHHPEYWFSVSKNGTTEIMEIPKIYLLEMVADWIGAGVSYGNDIKDWLPENIGRFTFHKDSLSNLSLVLNELQIITVIDNDKLIIKT